MAALSGGVQVHVQSPPEARARDISQSLKYIVRMALQGHRVSTYDYAMNKPIHFTDRNGLYPDPGTCSDALYTDKGIYKIPNNCKCTVECDSQGTQSIECTCFQPFWKRPEEFNSHDKRPDGWPENPFIPMSLTL